MTPPWPTRCLLLDGALQLARRGARVFPCLPRGKVPLVPHGCLDATSDARTIRRWWARWPGANLGLATGGGLLVLDVDPRHGGDAGLAALEALPATREALTGGGGRHLYLRATGPVRCSAGRLRPGLDVRGEGGYVVAPPSVHPSGALYRWHPTRGLAHAIADAPAWFLELLWPRPRPARVLSFEVPPDLARRVNRARRYLAALPPAISGSGGHAATWAAALALVRGFELPPEVAFELLARDFNPRCEPPWSERELRHKVESAARDAEAERGYLLRPSRRPAARPLSTRPGCSRALSKGVRAVSEPHAAPDVAEQPLLTAEELAAALRVSRSWVYEAARNGTLPFLRVGALKRFDLAEVKAALRGESVAPARVLTLPR